MVAKKAHQRDNFRRNETNDDAVLNIQKDSCVIADGNANPRNAFLLLLPLSPA